MKANIEAYQKLYESALAYGIRKTLIADHEKGTLEDQVEETNSSIQALESQIRELDENIENTKAEDENIKQKMAKKHEEDVGLLNKKNQRLKEELEKRLIV